MRIFKKIAHERNFQKKKIWHSPRVQVLNFFGMVQHRANSIAAISTAIWLLRYLFFTKLKKKVTGYYIQSILTGLGGLSRTTLRTSSRTRILCYRVFNTHNPFPTYYHSTGISFSYHNQNFHWFIFGKPPYNFKWNLWILNWKFVALGTKINFEFCCFLRFCGVGTWGSKYL